VLKSYAIALRPGGPAQLGQVRAWTLTD
jgi:hypothetical protein